VKNFKCCWLIRTEIKLYMLDYQMVSLWLDFTTAIRAEIANGLVPFSSKSNIFASFKF